MTEAADPKGVQQQGKDQPQRLDSSEFHAHRNGFNCASPTEGTRRQSIS